MDFSLHILSQLKLSPPPLRPRSSAPLKRSLYVKDNSNIKSPVKACPTPSKSVKAVGDPWGHLRDVSPRTGDGFTAVKFKYRGNRAGETHSGDGDLIAGVRAGERGGKSGCLVTTPLPCVRETGRGHSLPPETELGAPGKGVGPVWQLMWKSRGGKKGEVYQLSLPQSRH